MTAFVTTSVAKGVPTRPGTGKLNAVGVFRTFRENRRSNDATTYCGGNNILRVARQYLVAQVTPVRKPIRDSQIC